MADTTDDERTLINSMQGDTADLKRILTRLERNSAALATINHEAGRLLQAADAMVWAGSVKRLHGDLIAAHGVASRALIEGFDNGGEIVVQGGPR